MKNYRVVYSVYKDDRFVFSNITSERGVSIEDVGKKVQDRALPFLIDKRRFTVTINEVWEDE